MNSDFRIEDAVNVISEIAGLVSDVAQERRFMIDNRDAIESKNFVNISNRLDMTKEKYKAAIGIFSTISSIADEVAPQVPRRKTSSRMHICSYCFRYSQQDSNDCKNCHALNYFTGMIPIYAVVQKAGEKGVEWGIDWLLEQFADVNNEDKAKIKGAYYAGRYL